MKTINIKALALALACSVIAGCTTVRTITEKPQCTTPALAYLPPIESSQLEALDDGAYWALMTREKRLTDWALEMESMLEELCDGPD